MAGHQRKLRPRPTGSRPTAFTAGLRLLRRRGQNDATGARWSDAPPVDHLLTQRAGFSTHRRALEHQHLQQLACARILCTQLPEFGAQKTVPHHCELATGGQGVDIAHGWTMLPLRLPRIYLGGVRAQMASRMGESRRCPNTYCSAHPRFQEREPIPTIHSCALLCQLFFPNRQTTCNHRRLGARKIADHRLGSCGPDLHLQPGQPIWIRNPSTKGLLSVHHRQRAFP